VASGLRRLLARRAVTAACVLVAGLGAELGCAGRSTSHTGHEPEGTGGTAGSGGDASVGGASVAGGGVGAQSVGSAGLDQSGSAGMTPMHPPDVCAEVEASSYRHVLDLVFAVDRSAAMASGWADATAALSAFFRDPAVTNVAVSLRFFPDDRPVAGCDAESCSMEACATPLVPLGELDTAPGDAQETRLEDAVAGTETSADAPPQVAAYRGAVAIARGITSEHESATIVLVTASLSSSCGRDLDQAIADTYAESGIPTYVVAPADAPDFDALDALADSGGTGKALRFGAPDESNPLYNLFPISGVAYACDLPVPNGPAAPPLDYYLAWMTVSLDGNAPFEVPRVMSQAHCQDAVAYFYDDNSNPESIGFCPALCEELTQNRDAHVKVSFPCLQRLE
jgi:hypothetical protein